MDGIKKGEERSKAVNLCRDCSGAGRISEVNQVPATTGHQGWSNGMEEVRHGLCFRHICYLRLSFNKALGVRGGEHIQKKLAEERKKERLTHRDGDREGSNGRMEGKKMSDKGEME
ncbi:unnamed protein product [Pleuronectes platessa]|uniref:Uncharacterized protein n=1 Tax=Pleuronectes platessa TaxID=8262 RepID=A0A9N7TJH8_PLEPL|nr:unnamed protein product [Pleuronectes platessa]